MMSEVTTTHEIFDATDETVDSYEYFEKTLEGKMELMRNLVLALRGEEDMAVINDTTAQMNEILSQSTVSWRLNLRDSHDQQRFVDMFKRPCHNLILSRVEYLDFYEDVVMKIQPHPYNEEMYLSLSLIPKEYDIIPNNTSGVI